MIDAATLIKARLTNHAGLTAIVGDRIYLNFAPDDRFPCVTYEFISDNPVNDKDGYRKRVQRWEINTWSQDATTGVNAAEQIEDAILADGNDLIAYVLEGGPDYERDTGIHRYRQDFSIWF